MASDLKIRVFLVSCGVSDEYRFASLRSAHINFSKEKKEKKKAIRPSGRFQKSKFFRKNTTRYVIEIDSV
ncbi:hypothetical protein [Flavobacterium sp.]|uniref:hypothetical protein n=1 Tax=Flavobacterium sp. TaxID=239 RepID=UPI0037C18663